MRGLFYEIQCFAERLNFPEKQINLLHKFVTDQFYQIFTFLINITLFIPDKFYISEI